MIEMILAATIFAIVTTAVFGVFRTGTRAYESSTRDSAVLQRARYVFDSLERDIAMVFYRDETSYNQANRALIEEYQRMMFQAEENDDWDEFERRFGPREDRDNPEGDPNYVGNPFERGKLIDLQFIGMDSGDGDGLTFAVQEPLGKGSRNLTWGLARVEYSVQSGVMIRGLETIEAAPRDWMGEVLPREEPPDYSILAEGVVAFNLRYGFWFDNQWYEVEGWESNGRTLRNATALMGTYDENEFANRSQAAGIDTTEAWNALLDDMENQPLNRLPAYVRAELVIADPKNPKRTSTFTRLFRVPGSQETWLPNMNLEDEEQEMEREVRDEIYVPVYPGAMRKTG